ncbi:MAG TPA: type IV pilus biogenesis/stability protein PilW [Pseudorhodoplanes sp.]|nr:type IV pilus biogenesis/stability protein PilW [Pseudorhodoplanes sp.]
MSIAALSLALGACASSGGQTAGVKSGAPAEKNDAAELQVKLGRGYMDKGEFETAHEKLERAIQLDPKSVDAQTLMAVLYERIDRPKLAEKHYQRAVELDPTDGSTNNNFGAYLCRLGRYDQADTYFQRALDDPFYKTPGAAFSNAGLCAAQAGNVEKSEAYFRRSLEANPKDTVALFEMAQSSFRKSDFMRARAFIQRYEASSQPDASALDLAARIEERLGDKAAAAKYRERLKTEFPDYQPGAANPESSSP